MLAVFVLLSGLLINAPAITFPIISSNLRWPLLLKLIDSLPNVSRMPFQLFSYILLNNHVVPLAQPTGQNSPLEGV